MTALCSVQEAAELLDVTAVTVYRLVNAGRLRVLHKAPGLTGSYTLSLDDVRELAAERRANPPRRGRKAAA